MTNSRVFAEEYFKGEIRGSREIEILNNLDNVLVGDSFSKINRFENLLARPLVSYIPADKRLGSDIPVLFYRDTDMEPEVLKHLEGFAKRALDLYSEALNYSRPNDMKLIELIDNAELKALKSDRFAFDVGYMDIDRGFRDASLRIAPVKGSKLEEILFKTGGFTTIEDEEAKNKVLGLIVSERIAVYQIGNTYKRVFRYGTEKKEYIVCHKLINTYDIETSTVHSLTPEEYLVILEDLNKLLIDNGYLDNLSEYFSESGASEEKTKEEINKKLVLIGAITKFVEDQFDLRFVETTSIVKYMKDLYKASLGLRTENELNDPYSTFGHFIDFISLKPGSGLFRLTLKDIVRNIPYMSVSELGRIISDAYDETRKYITDENWNIFSGGKNFMAYYLNVMYNNDGKSAELPIKKFGDVINAKRPHEVVIPMYDDFSYDKDPENEEVLEHHKLTLSFQIIADEYSTIKEEFGAIIREVEDEFKGSVLTQTIWYNEALHQLVVALALLPDDNEDFVDANLIVSSVFDKLSYNRPEVLKYKKDIEKWEFAKIILKDENASYDEIKVVFDKIASNKDLEGIIEDAEKNKTILFKYQETDLVNRLVDIAENIIAPIVPKHLLKVWLIKYVMFNLGSKELSRIYHYDANVIPEDFGFTNFLFDSVAYPLNYEGEADSEDIDCEIADPRITYYKGDDELHIELHHPIEGYTREIIAERLKDSVRTFFAIHNKEISAREYELECIDFHNNAYIMHFDKNESQNITKGNYYHLVLNFSK